MPTIPPNLTEIVQTLKTHGIELSAFLEAAALWDQLTQEDRNQLRTMPRRKPVQYQRIIDMYNTICKGFPKVKKATEDRKAAMRARFASGYDYEDFQRLFEMAMESDYLRESAGNVQWLDFDWLITRKYMTRVLEGKYSRSNRQPPTPSSSASYDLAEIERYINTAPLGE